MQGCKKISSVNKSRRKDLKKDMQMYAQDEITVAEYAQKWGYAQYMYSLKAEEFTRGIIEALGLDEDAIFKVHLDEKIKRKITELKPITQKDILEAYHKAQKAEEKNVIYI